MKDKIEFLDYLKYLHSECNEFIHNNNYFRSLIYKHQHHLIENEKLKIRGETIYEIYNLIIENEIKHYLEIAHQFQDRYVCKMIIILEKRGVRINYE